MFYFILMRDNFAAFHQTRLFISWTIICRVKFRANARFWKLCNSRVVDHIQCISQYTISSQIHNRLIFRTIGFCMAIGLKCFAEILNILNLNICTEYLQTNKFSGVTNDLITDFFIEILVKIID